MAGPVIWIEAEPRNPATGATQLFRMAGGGADQPYRLNNVDWQSGITDLPVVVTALQIPDEFDFGGSAIPQALQVIWKPAGKAKLAAAAALYWPDAAITVQIGREGTAPVLIASGKVLTATIADEGLVIVLSDPAAAFALPILTDRFGGTGGADGPVEWAGKIKPRAWGRCFNVEAQQIDTGHSIFCLTDPAHPLQSIDAIRDGGRAADPATLVTVNWQGSVAATFTALQAAAAPAGGGVVCPSIGCVKWWTTPQSTLTCDLHGEVGTGYVETAAGISERIVQARSGPAFAAGEVAASAAAKPGASGYFVTDETATVGNALATLLGGTGQLWAIDGAGQVRLRLWQWGASAASFTAQEVSRRRVFKPVKTRKFGYHPNSRVMNRAEIVSVVLDPSASVDARLTRDNVTVPADKDGNLAAGVLDGAGGKFTVKIGNEDVSADAEFSVQPGTVGGTVTIDAAGNYKPTALTALALTATLRATYNGVDFDRVYDLTKVPAGQDGAPGSGANARLLFIVNDRSQITYDGTGTISPASQPITFTLEKQNLSTATVLVSGTTTTGTAIDLYSNTTGSGTVTNAGGGSYTQTGVTITMSAAAFDFLRGGTEGIIITVSHADGVQDKCDIVRSKAGAPGSGGTPGNPGAPAKTIYVRSSRQQITYDASGAINPASQPIAFTAVKQNTTNTVTWRVFRQDEVEVSAASYLDATSGDVVNMTAAAFDAARGSTQGIIVRGYLTADGIQDEISVLRAPSGANGAAGQAARTMAPASSTVGINCDYLGNAKSGELPKNDKCTFLDGGADVSGSTTWGVVNTGCTTAIGTTGNVSLSTIGAADGYSDVTGTYAGTTLNARIYWTLNKDPAPPSTATSATTSINSTNATTAYLASPQTPIATVAANGSGQLRAQASAEYYTTGGATSRQLIMAFEVGYRAAGSAGAWSFAAEQIGSPAQYTAGGGGEPGDNSPGGMTSDQTITGLVAGSSYEVGLFMRKSSGGGPLQSISGLLIVSQS